MRLLNNKYTSKEEVIYEKNKDYVITLSHSNVRFTSLHVVLHQGSNSSSNSSSSDNTNSSSSTESSSTESVNKDSGSVGNSEKPRMVQPPAV